ncbi:hypothetical protein DEJ50_31665 [Streptomyces venezuelae]|uniref:NifU family protein n=1 Tax=Streptomyces venezuelae TaxID=54571 RepID=A0A5P2D982_STRVZ|nr:NifU family protein [Streptomyces venezuelae]QES51732.1 hypothetical protein DEJ50_31665 [Streptomyces venezuelae]
MSAPTAPRPTARQAPNAEQAGRRVEEILDRLAAAGDHRAAASAEELVRVLMDFYGAGLARIVELLEDQAPQTPQSPLPRLLEDELVSGLLVLHDLHPEDTATRIARALDGVPHPVEVVEFDTTTGTLRLRSAEPSGAGSGCGCPSTGEAVRQAVETAVAGFAPEVNRVELEQPTASSRQPALLQIGTRPPATAS